MRYKYKLLLYLLMTLVCLSCGTLKAPYYSDSVAGWSSQVPTSQNETVHTLYLIGDAGELDDTTRNRNYVLDAMSSMLQQEEGETSLVYLGDNVYPHGLPKKMDPYRSLGERILNAQLDLAKDHNGRTYFIPGNHDWNKHKKGGRKAIKRQEEYIEDYFDGKHEVDLYPSNACGDPKVVKIHKDLVYVFLDTQWWLQNWSKEKKMNQGCEIKSRGDLLKRFEEIIADHKNDEIVVMLHHPTKSNGKHGGNFNLKHHMFPLREAKSNLWIPLPIIGSLYPMYRNVTGSTQDITNVKNQEMMQGLDRIAKKWRVNIIFAAGHDHGVQYFDDDRIKYIVSGGGSREDHIQKGGDASYAREARGFAKIEFLENNESWLEIYTVAGFDEPAVLEFRTQLRAPKAGTIEEEIKYPSITEDSMTIAANDKFAANGLKKVFLGSQYRDIWATPVTAEIIDLESKLGGLTPIKKGGGMASNSLRMEQKGGKQYILRSIKKDYTKLVPPGFSNLKLIDVLADQNSASHPYNALIIPRLSQAAGVYYTDPKLVYLKHQKGLGNYNSQFNEELYLLEERPSGDWSDAAQFGNASEIIGYVDLLDVLREKKNHFIDQKWVLKSRMFDLFIHDWDRHDDQWRWAKFEEESKNIYRPIPRDRDQALYKFVGVVPWYISVFMQKNFKTMKEDCKDVIHQSFNAKHFDRYFLHELEWDEWQEIIVKLQNDISDLDIDDAVLDFPNEIKKNEDVLKLASILKARRNNLMKMGRRLYDFLSQEVEITATDNDDRFEILQNDDGSMNIRWFTTREDKGDLLKYDRTFYPKETKEIRLYGLRGKDEFIISGDYPQSISLRIIGGEDKDILTNTTDSERIYAYDDLKGMKMSENVVDRRSDNVDINEYDRNGFTYDTSFPTLSFGNSVDDGWWFGGAMSWVNHSWRMNPYKSKQSFSFSTAPGSRNTLLFNYNGHFPDALGGLDLVPEVDVRFPHYENYFELGPNSTNTFTDLEYNWVRMNNIDVAPLIRIKDGNNSFLDFGPQILFRKVNATENRIVETESEYFTDDALDSRKYVGVAMRYQIGSVDSKVFPANGFMLHASANYLREPSKDENVTDWSIKSKFYLQLLVKPKLTFATQLGYARSYGDQQFYQYAALGNNNGLRGFRNERFRGESVFYHNLDLRLKLFKWDNTIIPMDIGLVGGYDYGRVGFGEEMKPWRTSQTVGIWFELLGAMIIQPYYSLNDEQNTFSLKAGFAF